MPKKLPVTQYQTSQSVFIEMYPFVRLKNFFYIVYLNQMAEKSITFKVFAVSFKSL